MNWAFKRQLTIIIIIAGAVLAVLVPVVYHYIPEPSCTDNKQNQGELGVDCGGPCTKVCSIEASTPSVVWARPFLISGTMYSAVAFISNPNPFFFAHKVNYRIKYFEGQEFIRDMKGTINIPPKSNFPVFIEGRDMGGANPDKVLFSLDENINWERSPSNISEPIKVRQTRLSVTDSTRVYTTLTNDSLSTYKNIEVTSVIYDLYGNALAASETFIERLSPHEDVEAVFTWPSVIATSTIGTIEVYPTQPNW